MKVLELHSWNASPKAARQIQQDLKKKISFKNSARASSPKTIAGADVSYSKKKEEVYAAAAVFSFPNLKLLEESSAVKKAALPYVPGLLAFREGPALTEAFKKLHIVPDVILFDGQGIAHPRGIGIATHVGILLNTSSIGVAKTVLVGEYTKPKDIVGSASPLVKDGKRIGIALRTRKSVKPVFVSVGHKIDLEKATDTVLKSLRGYRLPEPLRHTHLLSNNLRKKLAK